MTLLLILLQIIKFIVLFILFVVLIVLFVPYCYKVRAAKEETVNAHVIFTWLFGIIHIEYEKKGEKNRVRVKLFGVKLIGYKRRRAGKAKEPALDKPTAAKTPPLEPASRELEIKNEQSQKKEKPPKPDKKTADIKSESAETKDKKDGTADDKDDDNTETENTEKKSIFDRISSAKEKFDMIYNHPDKDLIIDLAKKLLKRLFAAIKPRKFSLDATLGLGEPHLVGYALAAVGFLRGVTGLDINATGVFDRKVLHFVGYVEGRIYVYRFLFPIIRFLLARPIFKLIKQFLFRARLKTP